VYPVQADGVTPFEIPMPGRVRYMDLWVWGSNLNYRMEGYVRDHRGVVHVVSFGSIAHNGWRNIRADVPDNIPQMRRAEFGSAPLRFVKFRIWTQPSERVNDFFIYLNQFKVLTDTFESIFDGDELADPDLVPQLWANSTN